MKPPRPAHNLKIQRHRSSIYGVLRPTFRRDGKIKHSNHGRITGLTLASNRDRVERSVFDRRRLGNGASISAEGSWIMGEGFGFNMAFTVILERAMVDNDLRRGADALQLFEEGKAPRTLTPAGTDGYVGELSQIVRCVQSGRPPQRVTARDALSAVELWEAEELSIRSGRVVSL